MTYNQLRKNQHGKAVLVFFIVETNIRQMPYCCITLSNILLQCQLVLVHPKDKKEILIIEFLFQKGCLLVWLTNFGRGLCINQTNNEKSIYNSGNSFKLKWLYTI